MPEKKKPELWETKNWAVWTIDHFPSTPKDQVKKTLITKGKLILGDDSLLIGNFSLKYIHIIQIGVLREHFITLQGVDKQNYMIMMGGTKQKYATSTIYPILSEKIKQFEEGKKSEAIEIIKNLPKLYKEISFDELIIKTGLQLTELMNIIESLVSNGELNANISGNQLNLIEKPAVIASPKGYEIGTSKTQISQEKEGILVFVSYATKDSDLYKISEVAHKLESYKEIGEVLYWQEHMHDSIIEYMNDNLGRCDVVLLFCSPNALDSVPVKKEWMAAEALRKPVIPIFLKPEHIPPLLSDRLGFEFDNFDFQKNVREIHELLLKKKQS